MDKIKLGFVPTRRSIFSAPDAIKYRGLTADRLREIGVDIVDIDDINDEGLLFDDSHIEPIVKKFRAEGVDGIMLCHANFGTEYVCARLARELGLPVLLWGPRDERPEPDGTRLRDSQCGLFATGKVLRRFQVPFTYMTNCRLTDPEFERGVLGLFGRLQRGQDLQAHPHPADGHPSIRLLVDHVQRGRAAREVQHPAFAYPHDRTCPGCARRPGRRAGHGRHACPHQRQL